MDHAEVAQLVERRLPKPKVAGSTPVFRSNWSSRKRGCFYVGGIANIADVIHQIATTNITPGTPENISERLGA